jgi:calcineurin-like phosphoesterase family protein
MNRAMIERWNQAVGAADTVWHLGDFALRMAPAAAAEILQALQGRKHLIVGNNDPPEVASLPGWDSVAAYKEISAEGRALVLCHYAFRSWNGMAKGALNLHGHSHGRLKPLPRQYDVGVDVWDYRPVTLAQLMQRSKLAAAAGGWHQPAP